MKKNRAVSDSKEEKRTDDAVDPRDIIPKDFDKEQEKDDNRNPGLPEVTKISPSQLVVPQIVDLEADEKKRKMLGRKTK